VNNSSPLVVYFQPGSPVEVVGGAGTPPVSPQLAWPVPAIHLPLLASDAAFCFAIHSGFFQKAPLLPPSGSFVP